MVCPRLGLRVPQLGVWTAPAWLLNPGPLVPPVTSTLPSARSVAFIWRRAKRHPGTVRQDGRALVEIDHLGRRRRRVAAAGVQDLSRRVHHRGSHRPVSHLPVRHRGPLAGSGDVQIASGLGEAGQEHLAVRRDEHRRVVGIGDRQRAVVSWRQALPFQISGMVTTANVVSWPDTARTRRWARSWRRVVAALCHRAGGGPALEDGSKIVAARRPGCPGWFPRSPAGGRRAGRCDRCNTIR